MDYSNNRKAFWRKTIKERATQAFQSKCCVCLTQDIDKSIYDFHHINPNEKEMSIGSGPYNGAKTWLIIRDELKKCIMLCSNCHRKFHNLGLDIKNPIYFDESFYDWEMTDFKQVTKIDDKLISLDRDKNVYVCSKCGNKKSPQANQCFDCATKEQMKCERPSRDELKGMIRTMAFTAIGKKYNVSDNSIRKWCDSYKLPRKVSEIKQISDIDWQKI